MVLFTNPVIMTFGSRLVRVDLCNKRPEMKCDDAAVKTANGTPWDHKLAWEMFGWPVMIVWVLQWLAALALSRYAQRRARQDYDMRWAQWSLLPAYDGAIILKKLGLGLLIFSTRMNTRSDCASLTESSAAATAFEWISIRLYDSTDVMVITNRTRARDRNR